MGKSVRKQSKSRFELLSNWRFRIRVLITLATFLILSVGSLTYLSTREYRDADKIENNTYETISIIKQTQLLILRGSSIDKNVIDRMKKLETNTQSKLVDNLIDIFFQSFKESVDQMEKAINENEYTELGETAHSFKSTCANVGAYKMKKLGDIIERASITKDNTFTLALITELKNEFQKVEQELKNYA